jgi:hypothetical protein
MRNRFTAQSEQAESAYARLFAIVHDGDTSSLLAGFSGHFYGARRSYLRKLEDEVKRLRIVQATFEKAADGTGDFKEMEAIEDWLEAQIEVFRRRFRLH